MPRKIAALRLMAVTVYSMALSMLVFAGPVYAQQLQHVPGTGVSLIPMGGFTPSTGLAGFIGSDGGAIMVTELPSEAYDQIIEEAKNPGKELVPLLAAQGITLQKIEELTTASGEKVPLFTGIQGNLDKWMGLFKGTQTVWIVVQSPRANKLDAAVRTMMASVTLGPPATRAEQIAALPFAVKPAAPFRFSNAYSGVSVGLTVGEKDTDPDDTQPWIAISYEPQPARNQVELDRFAEDHLTDPRRFVNARIETKKAGTVAGANGTIFAGTYEGQAGKPSRPKYFMQYLAITDSGRTIVMSATIDRDSVDTLKPAIEAIARSITIKPGN
jgi:hypothetical protein